MNRFSILLAALLAAVTFSVAATVASAHTATLSGVASCTGVDGSWKIVWTLTTSDVPSNRHISAIDIGITDGNIAPDLHKADFSGLDGAGNETGTATTSYSASQHPTSPVEASGNIDFSNGGPQNVDVSASVKALTECKDVCPNIDGAQATVPAGDFINAAGNCVVDVCPNLEGGQETLPAGYFKDGEGQCIALGHITVVKDTNPETSDISFDFDGNLGDFDLKDDQSITFDRQPGTYNFSENNPTGWHLVDIQCTTSGSLADVEIDDSTESVAIALKAGVSVTCEYVNAPDPVNPTPTPTPTSTPVTITHVVQTECVGDQLITRTDGVITLVVQKAAQCAPTVVTVAATPQPIAPPKSGDGGLIAEKKGASTLAYGLGVFLAVAGALGIVTLRRKLG